MLPAGPNKPMQEFRLLKGLDLPVSGTPEQTIHEGPKIKTVALIGPDYLGLKPRIEVQEGDTVTRGQTIFFHKDMPDVKMVAPVSGQIKAINRGARRVLESVVIDIADEADQGVDFSQVGGEGKSEDIATKLCASGLWTSFRTRPYSKVPDPSSRPSAIFVTAMDTEPLAPDANVIIDRAPEAFERGLSAIAKLTEGTTYLCHNTGANLPGSDIKGVKTARFKGPHPAGLAGTHIHFLEPPKGDTPVWSISYQDVIAIGQLMISGFLDPTRVIAISGPLVQNPRLVRTLTGASIADLTQGEYEADVPVRFISGSILSGREASDALAYLGRYARQITLIEEDKKQTVLGWIRPMAERYAIQPVLGSAFSNKLYALTSNMNGGRRAMVPIGTFEELMPQDYLPTQLLRAMLVMDTDAAQDLGIMELDEEDLGLVGFACPAKYEYGIALRDCLTKIEKEG